MSTPQAARVLGIPPIVTEQYPKGLGPTVPELGAGDLTAHAKTKFTMMIEPVEKELKALGDPKIAILCGIETQACIAVRPQGQIWLELVPKLRSVISFSLPASKSRVQIDPWEQVHN